MTIETEIAAFDEVSSFVSPKLRELALTDAQNASQDDLFLAEAVAFRIYRGYERFSRAVFLTGCTSRITPNGAAIESKLRCEKWDTAEEILKAGRRFLDWGDPSATQRLANLVFENGFPINEVISPIHSTLIDLRRVRNFIAHDSKEAHVGFAKVIEQYVAVGAQKPNSAGELLLSRRRAREKQTIDKLFEKVSKMTEIYAAL